MNKCTRCPQKATFHVLIESEENPHKSEGDQLCGNCLHQAKLSNELIDYWTEEEWDLLNVE